MDENLPQDEGQATTSGNRWESPGVEPPAGEPAPWTPYPSAPATPPDRQGSWWRRSQAGLAAAAAAVLVAAGLGGFALGRGTADGGHDDRTVQPGVPAGFSRDGGAFPAGPGVPSGAPPGSGQVPDMPGPDDGRQDNGTNGSDT